MAGPRQRSGGRSKVASALAWTLGALLVAGIVLWLVPAPAPDRAVARDVVPEAVLAAAPTAAGPASAAPPADPPPEGMTAEQWQMLQVSLKDDPHRDTEIRRITDYMAFLSRLSRFRALRSNGAGDLPEARTLARGLLQALPRHVAQGEVNAGEAQAIQQALLDTLYADDPARQAAHDEQRRRLAEALPNSPAASAAAARDDQYQRAQAAVVAQWYAKPEAERDPRELEASLDALRRESYPSPSTNAEGTR